MNKNEMSQLKLLHGLGRPLIELDQVSVTMGRQILLRHIDWEIHPGEQWVVSGSNGSGKTTLLKVLNGDYWPDEGGKRIYRLNGEDQESPIGLKERMAYLAPETQIRYLRQEWNLSAWEVVLSGFFDTDLIYRIPTESQYRQARNWVEKLGILSLMERPFQQLSYGELQKVLLARVLVRQPTLLFLDEFFNGMDHSSRRSYAGIFSDLIESGIMTVMTTHRPDEIIAGMTHLLKLEKGHVVSKGQWVKNRRKSISQKMESEAVKFPISLPPRKGRIKELISFHQADISIDINAYEVRTVLEQVTWRMNNDENWVVTGSNGSGKTTFLNAVWGETSVGGEGRVMRFGQSDGYTLHSLRQKMGYISPRLQVAHVLPMEGWQVVASGFYWSVGLHDRPTPTQLKRVEELGDWLGIEELYKRDILELSFGEMRKLLLARALVHQPLLLLLDEPFDGLDGESRIEFSNLICRVIRETDTRLILATHRQDEWLPCLTHRAVFDKGTLVWQGRMDHDPALSRRRGKYGSIYYTHTTTRRRRSTRTTS